MRVVLRRWHAFAVTDVLPRIELHRLEYSVRRPSGRLPCAKGDIDALDDVMRRCSLFWNGAGTLIVPVSADGRINRDIANLRAILDPERCFVHDSVTQAGHERLRSLFAATSPLRDDFDNREAHPLAFAPVVNLEAGELRHTIEVPVFPSASLQRATLACWGHIADDDLPYWEERFDPVRQEDRVQAMRALLAGQLSPDAPSPLLLSRRNMEASRWVSPQDWPYLVGAQRGVVDRPLLELPCSLLYVSPRHAGCRYPEVAPQIRTASPPDQRVARACPRLPAKPRPAGELPAARTPTTRAGAAQRGSDARGSAAAQHVVWAERTAEADTDLPAGAIAVWRPHDSRVRRDFALVPIAHRMSLALEPPEQFDLRTGQFVRLTLRNLPLPLPLTASAAVRIHPNGFVSDGLTIVFGATRRYSFDLELPPPEQALLDWAADHGYTARPTQDSRYAQAFLGRLGEIRPRRARNARSPRPALATRTGIAEEARAAAPARVAAAGIPVTEESLAERLKGGGVNLELSVRAPRISPG